MSHFQSVSQYAFGYNHVDQCPCPAAATGRDPTVKSGLLEVAEHYDKILKERKGEYESTVSAEEAEEVWLEAIDIRSRNGHSVAEAIEVANDLGWEVNNEE